MTITLACWPHYLSFLKPNYSWSVIPLLVFSHLGPEALHISLRTHKIQPREWKRKKKRRNTSKRKKREVALLYSSLCICRLSRACISAKLPQSYEKCWLISWLPCSVDRLVSSAPFCWLFPSLDTYIKPTVLFFPPLTDFLCLLLKLLSLLHFWSRAQALCVGFAPKQTKRSSEWHQQKRKWMLPITSHWRSMWRRTVDCENVFFWDKYFPSCLKNWFGFFV